MAFRVKQDGTIETDSLEEALALAKRVKGDADGSRVALPAELAVGDPAWERRPTSLAPLIAQVPPTDLTLTLDDGPPARIAPVPGVIGSGATWTSGRDGDPWVAVGRGVPAPAPVPAKHPHAWACAEECCPDCTEEAAPLRSAELDGERHVTRTDCCIERRCPTCQERLHVTSTSLLRESCETCQAHEWSPVTEVAPVATAHVGTPAWFAWFYREHGRDPSLADMSAAARKAEETMLAPG